MRTKAKFAAVAGALGLIGLVPGLAQASVLYSYTGSDIDGLQLTASFSAAAPLINLAPGTDITGDITGFSFDAPPPSADDAGFPVGTSPGDVVLSSPSVIDVGTDSLGNITSWNFSGSLFASYPAFPGENPNDFFCTYSVTASSGGDSYNLTSDNDVGFCPALGSGAPGSWTPIFTGPVSPVPEPITLSIFVMGLAGIEMMRRRKHAQGSN